MDIRIKVHDNRRCTPERIKIGFVGEKNIDKIALNISKNIDEMNWYLLFENKLYRFNNNILVINEELTRKSGTFYAYILGSDAKPGESITSGSKFFNSEKIIMKVSER